MLVRDPEGRLRDEAFFTTDVNARPEQILEWVVMRWSLEVAFEESRAHLGIETQRQWSDLAIARTTPVLFGLFSLVTLWADALWAQGDAAWRTAAWYEKEEPTFSDLIALVRRQLWSQKYFSKSAQKGNQVVIPKAALELLLDQLCYAA